MTIDTDKNANAGNHHTGAEQPLTSMTKTGFCVQKCLCSMEERFMRFIIF